MKRKNIPDSRREIRLSLMFLGLFFSHSSWSAVDPCLHCCEPIAPASAMLGFSADIHATLILALWDVSTGKPLWRILREKQATDAINNTKIIKSDQAASEGLRNGMVHYEQQAEQLELSREVETNLPAPTECSQSNVTPFSESGFAYSAEHGWRDLSRRRSFDSPANFVVDIKDRVTKPKGSPYSGGMISRPGCKPVFDPAVTAFETKVPVAVGWECEGNGSPRTILLDSVEASESLLNDILTPLAVPESSVGSRKTPAGQSYESLSLKYNIIMDIIVDNAQTALSRMKPIWAVPESMSSSLLAHGIDIGVETPSWMDYIAKWNDMKFDNPLDQTASYGVPTGVISSESTPPSSSPEPKKSPFFMAAKKTIGANWDRYDSIISQAGQAAGIDPFMIKAHIAKESSFNPNAIGDMVHNKYYPIPSWAGGLGQFMPLTASKEMGLQGVVNTNHATSMDERFIPSKAIPAMGQFIKKNHNAAGGVHALGAVAYFSGRGASYVTKKCWPTDSNGKATGPKYSCNPSPTSKQKEYIENYLGYYYEFSGKGLGNKPPPVEGEIPAVIDPNDPNAYSSNIPVDSVETNVDAEGYGGNLQIQTLRAIHVGQVVEQALWMELYKIESQGAIMKSVVKASISSIEANNP